MKTLVLYPQDENLYFPEYSESCCLMPLYKKNGLVNRVYRKFVLKLQLNGIKKIFGHWNKMAEEADKIILFDTGNVEYITTWLRKKYPKKRIILWYWNSVKDTIHPSNIKASSIEFWSFDKNDCRDYKMNYNIQFYFLENLKRKPLNKEISGKDVFYVGADKDRAKILYDLKKIFDKNNITYNFNLVKYKNSVNDYDIEYKNALKYPDVIENIRKSNIIVDLVADWQNGLTLRPLEALFFKKKIITNMKEIVDYDLYNANNVFILGVDNIENIVSFIKSNYDDSNREQLIKKYSMEKWLENFD